MLALPSTASASLFLCGILMVLKKHTTPLKVPSSIAVKSYNLIITFELSHLYNRELDIACMIVWIKNNLNSRTRIVFFYSVRNEIFQWKVSL